MTTVTRRPRATALMWVLMLSLLLGVGAMHTLGHASHEAPASAPVAGHAAAGAAHEAHDLPPLDPTSMCLAIGGFVVALLGVVRAALARWPASVVRPRRWAQRWLPRATAPPDPPSLAKLQVLRI